MESTLGFVILSACVNVWRRTSHLLPRERTRRKVERKHNTAMVLQLHVYLKTKGWQSPRHTKLFQSKPEMVKCVLGWSVCVC